MKFEDGWWFPDGEAHLPAWMADPRVRMTLNGRPAYQGQKQQAAMALCKQFRAAVDVGAHVGLWSFNLAHHFTMVHAFEPVAAHRDCFKRNVLESVATPNVALYPFALGDREGMVSIRTEPTSSGDSRVDGPGEIPIRRLDSFNLQDVDLLKIDAEGFELFILHGAEEMLARQKPVVIVEQKPGHAVKYGLGDRDAVPWLKSLGYRLERELSGDFLFVQ
jgi:FkbM family methyltransferase